MQVLQCNYIRQSIDLLEGLIPKRDDNKEIPRDHLEKLILFAIMWSLGALLEQADRRKVLRSVGITVITLCFRTLKIIISVKNRVCPKTKGVRKTFSRH